MENRINSRVVIAVNKGNKLLRYLRRLNSGDIEKVSVRIIGAPKGKPINLFFTRNLITNKFTGIGAVDSFLVHAGYSKSENGKVVFGKLVLFGSATINSLQKLRLTSVDNRESDECVTIDVYAKGRDALDFKELQDILSRIKKLSTCGLKLSTYGLASTSKTTLIELKPENKRIVSYGAFILPNSPLESFKVKKAIDSATDMVHSTEQNLPKYACHSKNSNSTVAESEKGTQEILRQRHNTDNGISYNIKSELVIASSMLKSDLKKPLKRWKKILEAKPIEVFTDTSLKAGYVVDFYIRESSIRVSRDANIGLITAYELVAKYSLNECIISAGKKVGIISGFVFKALHNAHAEYKQRKSENLDISHLESLLEKNQKTSNQKEDKDLINIIAETLREIESIGKASVNKCSKTAATEDLFCKKAKVNSKKDSSTTRPRQFPNPVVTILASDESKDKVKEIIEEANRTKRFPYMLDYDSNCVVRISDNLFDILECKNKLEDILKIKKDIDVGIFTLESTDGLVFKKMFNISSLTVYHSASKNLYALIGIY